MALSFSRTVRSLNADRGTRSILALIGGIALAIAWLAWLFGTRVAVYRTSDKARIEVAQTAHPPETQVGGRVLSSSLALGKQVAVAEVLVELDARPQQLELAEARASLRALLPQREALRAEHGQEEQTLTQKLQSERATLDQAQARYRESDTGA